MKKILHTIYSGPWYKKILVWLLTLLLLLVLFFIAVDINFLWLFGRSPSFQQIKAPVSSEASEIYSCDSVLLGRFFSENRTPVKYEDINPLVVRTLIATEDERFYKHHGVDFAGLFAALKDIAKGQPRGASTITQQLAKNLFRVRTNYSTGITGKIPGVKIFVMKAKEWIVATKLEMAFSKEDILTMYFNTVDFGSNSFGIKTAARTYFGTTPDSLDYLEAATLVGLLKATSTYNPRLHPEASQRRRNVVLQNLYQHGGLLLNGRQATAAQFDSLLSQPTRTVTHIEESSYDGLAPYFRTQLQDYINDLCDQGLVNGENNDRLDLYADGLRIYTTLDSRLQQYAEQSAQEQMRVLQQRFDDHWRGQHPWVDRYYREIPNFIEDLAKKSSHYKYLVKRFPQEPDSVDFYLNQPHRVKLFSYDGPIYRNISTMDSIRYMVSILHCGFVAIEPDTRHVKAWVGDVDFDSWKYDKVTAQRQPGSTFKLFVYAEAMNKGMNPCDRRLDAWTAYTDTIKGQPKQWAPHNANGTFSGANMTLKLAFAQSVNSIAVKLGYEVGIRDIIKTAHRMGIHSELEPVPSLSLGASDVNLLELVNSYCTVIDRGEYSDPVFITRIEDREGNRIFEAHPDKQHALSERTAFFMEQLLSGGLTQPGGTTAALWQYIHPVLDKADFGGKTGTSNNHSDAWFVGVTPKLVAGGWVGGEYRSIHFRTGQLGQGSRTALPIFGKFIARVLQDRRFSRYYAKFPAPPANVLPSEYECAATIFPNDTLTADSSALEGFPFEENIPYSGNPEDLPLEFEETASDSL